MAATFSFCEDNGAQTGSPAHGTTRTGFSGTPFATDVNWKNIDDCTNNSGTVFTSAPITAGNNSFLKFSYASFTGTFTEILNGLWSANTTGSIGSNLTLYGIITSTYITPVTTSILTVDSSAYAAATNFSSSVAIGSGLSFDFSTTGPQAASPTATLSSAGYSQYTLTQLQTAVGAAAGNTTTITLEYQYNEN